MGSSLGVELGIVGEAHVEHPQVHVHGHGSIDEQTLIRVQGSHHQVYLAQVGDTIEIIHPNDAHHRVLPHHPWQRLTSHAHPHLRVHA